MSFVEEIDIILYKHDDISCSVNVEYHLYNILYYNNIFQDGTKMTTYIKRSLYKRLLTYII